MTDEADIRSESLEDFFLRTRASMVAKAVALCGSREDAEDAVMDAYAAAVSRWDRISAYESLEGWIFKLVRQRLWKTARGRDRRRAALSHVVVPVQASAEQTAEARGVLAALATLPSRQRMVMVSYCLHAVPQDEIAEELRISRSAVAGHVFKARRTLMGLNGVTSTKLSDTRDALMAGEFPDLPTSVFSAADPILSALRITEAWLREGFESDPRIRELSLPQAVPQRVAWAARLRRR